MRESLQRSSDSDHEYGSEPLPPSETVGLHGQTMEVPVDAMPVIPKEAALPRHGIPGDVILIVRLLGREVAVVDYGEDVRRHRPVPFTAVRRTPDEELEKVDTRYGLRPFNYRPPDSPTGHVPIRPGRSVVIRSDPSEADDSEILRVHVTIGLAGDRFSIRDDSDKGIDITTAVPPDVHDYWA